VTAARALRYFTAIGLHPSYALVVLALVVLMGIWTTMMSPGELDSALGMVLFVQMFLASSGFVHRARRGHFDALLTSAANRTTTVASHWVASVLPGVVAWAVLVVCGYLVGSPTALSAMVGRRAAALFIVSAIAWATGFVMTRGAAGVLWTSALLVLLVRHASLLSATSVSAVSSGTMLRHAAILVLCPFLLIGPPAAAAPGTICTAISLAVAVLLCAWRIAAGRDIYLMERT
jgi:hypothetical protein